MTYYDITVPLQNGIPYWPGDEEPKIERYSSLSDGEITNTSRIQCSLHTGTHVDAPRHLFDEGKSIDQLPPETLIGPAGVVDVGEANIIDTAVLQQLSLPKLPRLLFKTRNSQWWQHPCHPFHPDFVSFTASAAEFLVENGVELVGIDYLSIDGFNSTELSVHKILLSSGVVVIEGLDLHHVPPGTYEMIALPLRIIDADGAPARVILRSE